MTAATTFVIAMTAVTAAATFVTFMTTVTTAAAFMAFVTTASSASFGTSAPHTTISRSLSIVSVFSVAADAPPMRTDRSSLKPVSHTPPTLQLLKLTAV